jgi:hypothetical protein
MTRVIAEAWCIVDQVIELVLFPTGRSVFDSTKVAHHCKRGDGEGKWATNLL